MNAYLVAHGKGSDPEHSGWLQRFSNIPDSEASSDGVFRTGDIYEGAARPVDAVARTRPDQ